MRVCNLTSVWVCVCVLRASLMAQTVQNLPAMRETRVRHLGWEDPLEKEMAAHSSILAWRMDGQVLCHGQRTLVGYTAQGRRELDMTEHIF